MMAAKAHWVSELFPVKFSLEDLLDDKEADSDLLKVKFNKRDHYQDVCNRVIASVDQSSSVEVAKPKDAEPGGLHDDGFLESKKEVVSGFSNPHEPKFLQFSGSKANLTSNGSNCIWTKEELDTFRDGFFQLKRRSVNLLILLSESKKQIKELKSKCREKNITISTQASKLSEQKKQSMKLNATIKELREDVKFSDDKMQQMLKIEVQLKDQNQFLKVELEDERKELVKIRELCTKLDKMLKKQRKEIAFGYMQQENVLKSKHLYAIEKLEKESNELRNELENERNSHQLTKIALEQLRKHFANMDSAVSSRQFLDVAECDNFGST